MVEYIADIGTAWCGDLDLLDYMVGRLKEGGATAFKPQVWPKSIYKGHELEKEALACHIDAKVIERIDAIASKHDLEVYFSVFDDGCLKMVLDRTGARRIKFAHSMRVEGGLIAKALLSDKVDQVIISVSDLGDFLRNVVPGLESSLKYVWTKHHDKVRLLHCVPHYPTDLGDVHFRHVFDSLHGFSDHTTGTLAPVVAVARGAHMIEKHVMCNREEYQVYLGRFPRFPDEVCAISLDHFALMRGECELAAGMIR